MVTTSTVRFSQFNASLNRNAEGQIISDFSSPAIPDSRGTTIPQTVRVQQAKNVAEIIQRTNPDVLLINEFDFFTANPTEAVRLFQQNFLAIAQNGATAVNYPYFYIAPSNTGIPTGFDLNNNGTAVATITDGIGTAGYGDDAFGFGNFPGQFGLVLLSKYPIDVANIRTFQNFLWKDMPGNLLTNDPTIDNPATPVNENLGGFYSAEEQAILRLSSKSHWDVPIQINGQTVHALVSHPTPPVFDGPEDRNGKRNADEIRFWSDYITPGKGGYIYDDKGSKGGLTAGSSFVIMGDQNADPYDGDSYNRAVLQLLQNPNINTNFIPTSPGGPQQAGLQGGANATQKGNPAFDTADFADTTPGNLRADYVLPSIDLTITNSQVFWPLNTDPSFPLVGTFSPTLFNGFPSSDHRLIYADIQIGATEAGKTVAGIPGFLGQTVIPTGTIPAGAAGSVNGAPVPLGGLSGVAYDAAKNQYYAISDDRSDIAPARFYTFTANPATLGTNGATFTNVTTLKDTNGNTFARFSLDPEDIALTKNSTVFISSEGEVRPDLGATRVTSPFIKEFNLATGQEIRSLAVPNKFLPKVQDTNGNGVVDLGDLQTSGVRNNLAFESLTITPDQKTLYSATESALFQDGPISTLTSGSAARIIQYNLVTGQPEKEYLYPVEAIAKAPDSATGFADNGLVDLLALDNRGTFLALERSFATGKGNTIRIYEVSVQGATDISVYDSLTSLTPAERAALQPVQKQLVLNLDDLKLSTGLDNVEGIEFGPKLADGRQSIVLVSDNNFSATQFTQILALGANLVPTVSPGLETNKDNLDDSTLPFSQRSDSDDPAIYVNATDSAKSLVVTAIKNGGLQVYNLAGELLQTINPGLQTVNPVSVRYNNVDLQYGFKLGGQAIDIAVASDRNNDKLVIFKINPNATDGNYLVDITNPSIGTLFQTAPFNPPYSSSARSAYGTALYRSPATGDYYAFVNRRQTGDVAQFKLVDAGNGTIGAERVRNFTVPIPPGAPTTTDPQLEGMVVDQETGFLYIGQENVGIWKYQAEPNGGTIGTLIDRVRALGGTRLTDDVEGLTIYYGANGTGYLLASSQGDNTFAVYSREGNNDYLGQFAVGPNGSIDGVQESDGADVLNLPLGPNFPFGLFVTQDGSNLPARILEGENINTNFKFVPWENIASAFPNPLNIDTTSYNPRTPQAQSLLNGIASGDTTQTSTVLWARSNFTGAVTFEYSTDANFRTISGTATANVTNPLQPVKVEVNGLQPNTQYFYRVTDAAQDSEVGKFSTAAAIGTQTGLRFGVSGDWRGELAPYPAIANADDRNLKFFVALGDTIYADDASPGLLDPATGLPKPQAETLDEFRAKHIEVYGDRFGANTWADLRASTSILATVDDHEVTNDFAGGELATSDPRFKDNTPGRLINDTALFDNGLKAFQEYNPLRDEFYGNTGDPRTAGERKIYRYNTYGNDAATFVLDTRSFRDAEIPGPTDFTNPQQVGSVLAQTFTPGRTLLGKIQLEDLKQDLLAAERNGISWKFVMVPEPIQNIFPGINTDAFEGYNAERTELLKFINDNQLTNVVFVAADVHTTFVNNLTYQEQAFGPQIATSVWEITTGAVAYEQPTGVFLGNLFTATNPQLKAFYDALPVAPDTDNLPNDKDDFVKQAVNDRLLKPLGFDPLGLDDNLPQANGLIDAKLLQGDYFVGHSYSWTEFDINPTTQKLTVTTYGIDAYTEAELLANPAAITSLTPRILSQFEVNAKLTGSRGTPGSDTLFGSDGDDTIFGLGGNDIFYAGDGNNVLRAGDGNDTLFAGQGNNLMDGAGGNNTFYVGDGNNRILAGNGSNQVYAGGGNNTITTGSDRDLIFVGNGNNTINAGNGNNEIYAGGGKNTITTGSGNDRIFVGNGDDIINSGAGDDMIYTGEGNNVVNTGTGMDTVFAGNGSDIFTLNTGTGFVTISSGFGVGDRFQLGTGLTFSGLTIAQSGLDTTISAGTDLLATVKAVSASTITSSQFVTA
jgi:myo-inositol-hexaphosphate 3-phosphohydrolase/phosphodiesterase/alkaline phosphatase D-like protein